MGYTVEVSFNIEKCSGISQKTGEIFNYALSCGSNCTYEDYEMSGNVKIPRRHCVIVSMFDEDKAEKCADYIKMIKRDRQLYVESVYSDGYPFNLIYASPDFIKNMEKRTAKAYREKLKRSNRSISLSEGETLILDAISSIKDKQKNKNKRSKSLGENPSLPISPYLSSGPTGLAGSGPSGPIGATGPFT